MSTATLMWGVIFGSVGMGYFVYGKKQTRAVPLLCGVLLIVVPYAITNAIALVAVGVVLMAIPFFIRW